MSSPDRTALWRSNRLLLAFSLGAAIVNLLPQWRPLVFASRRDLYFLPTLAAHDYVAALIWTFGITAVVFGVARWIAGLRRPVAPWLMTAFGSLLALNGLEFLRIAYAVSVRAALLGLGGGAALVVVAALAIRRWRGLGANAIASAAVIAIAIFSPFALTTAFQGLSEAVTLTSASASPRVEEAREHRARPPLRVAWVIFDELDRRVLTDGAGPYPYPHFDSLRARSVYLTHAIAPGRGTIQAMPSYWLGRRLQDSRAVGLTDLRVTLSEGAAPVGIDELETLFEALAKDGISSGATGFYHPYCRLFGAYLDRCRSFHTDTVLYYRTETLLDSLALAPQAFYPGWRRRIMIRVFESTRDAALDMLADPSLDFVAVHLNSPHDPPIYEPETGRLRSLARGLTYRGNIALADVTLGAMEARMREAGTWNHTALIVGADHGWRRLKGHYTEPGAIPLIVHLPGQERAIAVDQKVDALLTRPLIRALLRGEVATPEDTSAFLQSATPD